MHNPNLKFGFSTYSEFYRRYNYHLYKMTLPHGENSFIGYACDRDERNAVIRATSECIERFLFKTLNITAGATSALHNSYEVSRQKSISELFERDAYLTFHQNLPIKFENVEIKQEFKNEDLKIINSFLERNIQIKGLKLIKYNKPNYLLWAEGTLTSPKFGGIISIAQKSEHALTHAFSELLPNLDWAHKSNQLSIDQFKKLSKVNLENHFQLGLNLEYWKMINYDGRTNQQLQNEIEPEIETKTINLKSEKILDLDLYFSWSYSKGLYLMNGVALDNPHILA